MPLNQFAFGERVAGVEAEVVLLHAADLTDEHPLVDRGRVAARRKMFRTRLCARTKSAGVPQSGSSSGSWWKQMYAGLFQFRRRTPRS
jgi:hypothetical protein